MNPEISLMKKIRRWESEQFHCSLKIIMITTFRFIINNKPVFAKGVNWIPTDSFLPRVT